MRTPLVSALGFAESLHDHRLQTGLLGARQILRGMPRSIPTGARFEVREVRNHNYTSATGHQPGKAKCAKSPQSGRIDTDRIYRYGALLPSPTRIPSSSSTYWTLSSRRPHRVVVLLSTRRVGACIRASPISSPGLVFGPERWKAPSRQRH